MSLDYDSLKLLAYNYADRQDAEVQDRYDDFLAVVEARVNKRLKVAGMSCTTQVKTKTDKEVYGLPDDFKGLREISAYNEETRSPRTTLDMVNPAQLNSLVGKNPACLYYHIMARSLHIYPALDNMVLDITYYRRVPPLTDVNTSNWLLTDEPDIYLFGVLVEIHSFTKNAEATALWEGRFNAALQELIDDDADERWSGPTPRTRTA